MTPVPDAPLLVLFNAGAGRHAEDDAARPIRAALEASGRAFRLIALEPGSTLPQQIRAAVQQACEQGAIVVAAGGDGTISTVAHEVAGSGCLLGVIPQGTFNYFCRAYGISSDPAEAVQQMLDGIVHAVQAGRVNGRLFLVNASVGLYPLVLEDRERFKATLGRSRFVAALAALYTLLRRPVQLTLRLSGEGHDTVRRTPTLFVANNALQLQQTGLLDSEDGGEPELPAELDGRLRAVLLAPVSTPRLFGLALRGAFGTLGEADDAVLHFPFQQLDGQARGYLGGRRIKVATDGEVHWMRAPLRFEVERDALQLIVPTPLRAPVDEEPTSLLADLIPQGLLQPAAAAVQAASGLSLASTPPQPSAGGGA